MEFFLVESQFFRLVGQQKQHFLTLKTAWNFQGFFLKVNSISKDFASILPLFLSRKKVVKSIGDVFFQFKCRFVVKNARNVKFPEDVAENGLFFIQFHACLDWFINLYRGQERMGKEWKSEKKIQKSSFSTTTLSKVFSLHGKKLFSLTQPLEMLRDICNFQTLLHESESPKTFSTVQLYIHALLFLYARKFC